MRSFLIMTALLLCVPGTSAQPGAFADVRVSYVSVSPNEPTTSDTITVSYRFVAPSACAYTRDWKVKGHGGKRQLKVRITKPPRSICTADKEAPRTNTLRIPPLPAGEYQLIMEGNSRVEGRQFRYDGVPVFFTVRRP